MELELTFRVFLESLDKTSAFFVGGPDNTVGVNIAKEKWISLGRPTSFDFTPKDVP